jgi:hypothetical protein
MRILAKCHTLLYLVKNFSKTCRWNDSGLAKELELEEPRTKMEEVITG